MNPFAGESVVLPLVTVATCKKDVAAMLPLIKNF